MSSWYPSQQEQHVHVQHIADTEPKLYWKSPHELKCYGCGSRRSDAGEEVIYFASQLNRIAFSSGCRCPLLSVAWKPASDGGGVRTWWSSDFEKLFLRYSVIDRCQLSRASWSLLDFEKRCDQSQILRNDAVIVRFGEALRWSLAETQCDHSDWEMWSLGLLETLRLFWLLETTLLQTTAGGGVYKMNMKMWHSPYLFCEEKCHWKEMDSVTAVHF